MQRPMPKQTFFFLYPSVTHFVKNTLQSPGSLSFPEPGNQPAKMYPKVKVS